MGEAVILSLHSVHSSQVGYATSEQTTRLVSGAASSCEVTRNLGLNMPDCFEFKDVPWGKQPLAAEMAMKL